MLWRRALTTFLFLPPFLFGLLVDSPGQLVLALMASACSVWGLSEFFNLTALLGARPPRKWLYANALVLPMLVYARYGCGLGFEWLLAAFAVTAAGTLALTVFSGRVERAWETFMASASGMIYVVGPILLIQVFRQAEQGVWYIGFVVLTTWLSDTGAYFGGRAFGRHKMSPSISPGKTWEGLVSGFLLSLVGVLAFGWLVGGVNEEGAARFYWTVATPGSILRLGLLNIALVAAGTLGDLAESMLKRDLDVKDSGSPLTGHGGFLDIMDSLLVTLPLLFVWAILFEDLLLV